MGCPVYGSLGVIEGEILKYKFPVEEGQLAALMSLYRSKVCINVNTAAISIKPIRYLFSELSIRIFFHKTIPGLSRRACAGRFRAPGSPRARRGVRGSGSAPGFSPREARGERDAEGRGFLAPLSSVLVRFIQFTSIS